MRAARIFSAAFLLAITASLASACGGDDGGDNESSGGSSGSGGSAGSAGSSGSGGASGSGGSAGDAGVDPNLALGCKGTPPPGAQLAAAPKAYTGGTCPTLPRTTTGADIAITSSGNQRAFWLVVPENLQENEQLPIVFLWHWLGGEAQDFFERGEVQAAVDEQRFLAIIPQKKGDITFVWPYSAIDSTARAAEEAVFFDDLLSCVSEQFNVNSNCVASAGVSAGALWTDQLAGMRGEYLSSFMSLSGGVGGVIKPWIVPDHKMPALVLWGGPTDNCFGLLKFNEESAALETALVQGGHFFAECVHNCGHAVPPFESPPGSSKFKALWQFAFDHPFWLAPGVSPYATGLPADLPDWCGIGQGGATPRTEQCIDNSEC